MFRSLWFHKLLGLNSRSARRRQAAQTRRAVRLGLEGLEDRITPSGLPFATATNATQLLQDITFANANPNQAVSINLQAGGTYDLTDIGSSLVVTSKAGVTINGNGATINAALNNRVFEVDSGDKLALNNVTVTGGNVTQSTGAKGGGGILDAGGFLTLSGANVTGNAVHGGDFNDSNGHAQGGGVYVSGAGTLTMKNGASVSNNKAIGSTQFGSKGEAQGGGIYVTGGGGVTITSSHIDGNLARGGNSAEEGFNAQGGGLFMYGGSVVSITNSSINNNNARGGNGTGTNAARGGTAQGGGLYINGDGWKVSVTGTTVNGNTATGGAGGKGFKTGQVEEAPWVGHNGGNGGDATGGGAYVHGDGSGFNILSSSFNTNTAQGGAGGQGGPGFGYDNGGNGGNGGSASGGGLYYNTADDATGISIMGSSFDSNSALGGNGGLGGRGGVGTVRGGNGGGGGTGGSGEGGGMWLASEGAVNITNSSATNNNATGGMGGDGGVGGTGGTTGGAGGNGGNGGTGSGGGIFASHLGNGMTVINTTIGANTALGGNAGAGGAGGAGKVDGTPSNGANGGAGSAGSAFGGGLENFRHTSINLINDTVAFNVAQAGSNGANSPESKGGGIDGGNAEMINVILDLNIATDGPDYFGFVGAGSHHDFVSNTDGIVNVNVLKFGVGNILNNQNPQLGPLQGPGTSAGGTAWYPLLANSAVINAGSLSVQADIAKAQNVPIADITDQIGNPRVNSNGFIDMGAVSSAAATTSMTVSNVNVTQTSSPTPVQLTATLTSQTGELINEGVVTFTVTDPGNPLGGGTVANVQVMNGVASGSFTVPGNTPPGTFTITATYTDPVNGSSGGRFGGTSGTGTLTVGATPTTPASTTVKAGNASVNISSSSQTVNVLALVNSPAGTVDEGTMTVTLFDKTNNPVGNPFTAQVSGGSASVQITVPANFAAGTYNLQESYTDGTDFAGSSDIGTLTVVNPVSQPQSPMPVTVVNTPLTTTGTATITGPVTTTTNNDLSTAISLFMDIVAFVLDQNGMSSISAAFNLPTNSTDAFNLAAANFNAVGGSLGATLISTAATSGQQLVTSLQGK